MEKKVKKKVKIKIIPFLLFILFLGVLYLIINFLIKMPIKNIYIYDNTLLSDQEIIEILGIENYPSFLLTTSSKMKNRALSSDYIDGVSIKKDIFGGVGVKVKEAKALFIDTNKKLVLSNGNRVERKGEKVVPSLINYTPDNKFEDLVLKMANIDDDILFKISEIMYEPTDQDKDRFLFYMNDGNLVYVTLTKLVNINYYDSIIADIPCKRGILNLDSGNHFEIKADICE